MSDVKEEYEFHVNPQGVRIKKCCASCKFKECTNDNDRRKCTLSGKRVTKDFFCRSWHISRYFENLRVGYYK